MLRRCPNMNGGGMGGVLYFIVLAVIFWFLLIRPQQMQAKQRAEMLTKLKAGDKVITIGGLCGTIARITDDKFFVEISEGVVVEFLRNAISAVETEDDMLDDEDEDFDDLDDDEYYYDDEDDIIDVEPSKK